MKIAWNAIVKNEAAIIERCLKSILPHVDCGIVVDTGSTDGTEEIIKRAFLNAEKPVEIGHAPFENFSQARNVALQMARNSHLDWDYLLLADADMELKVDVPIRDHALNGGSYDMRQVAGILSYSNRRLVHRSATGLYVGVTHEYTDIPSVGSIDGAWFVDHADGANRPDKLQRDVVLLEEALDTETRPGLIARYHFYLAGTYFDLGKWEDAITHYQRRVEMGGFDEEVWYAQMRLAICYQRLGEDAHFLWEMLRAYNLRPRRGETLFELAQFFRLRGENFASLLFSDFGRGLPVPGDALFVNDWVYKSGLKEEFAICAYYDERRRRTGGKEANKLALAGSEQARSNLFWYLQPLSERVPSFRPMQIPFEPPEGWAALNPSVINRSGVPLVLVRTVNYAITEAGQYVSRTGDVAANGCPIIRTRNWLVRLAPDGSVASSVMLQLPENWPAAQFELVRGFEDSRLFEWHGQLLTLSTVRELTHEGWCEQVMAPLQVTPDGMFYGDSWNRIEPQLPKQHEKNWMPWPGVGIVYRLGTLIDVSGAVIAQYDTGMEIGHISGGSQVVQLDSRTWIALVHEARCIPGRVNRYYQHRFVSLQPDGRVDRISPPFFFHDRQIEFAAGLALFGEELMVSYGVRDCEAWVAIMKAREVIEFIYGDAL